MYKYCCAVEGGGKSNKNKKKADPERKLNKIKLLNSVARWPWFPARCFTVGEF
jgi:hypothetical protein